MLVPALHLELVDLVAEIGVAERIARRCRQRRIERVDPGLHRVGDDRQIIFEVDRLARNAEHRAADVGAGAVIVGRLRFRGRMMRVERHCDAARAFPVEVEAGRLVLAHVGAQRGTVRQVLTRRECLAVEHRACDGAIGPLARHVAEVEPHADAVVAHFDLVARIGEIGGRRQRVGRFDLKHGLPVDALAIDVADVVRCLLRDLVHIGRAGAVHLLRVARQRTPIVGRPQETVAEADERLVRARLAALVDAVDHDADAIVGQRGREDARHFGQDLVLAVLRRIQHAFRGEAAARTGLVERARRADVDRRADAARRHRGTARLVHLDGGDAFRREVREIERARCGCAGAVAQRRGRHLAAVQRDQVIFRAETAHRDE